MTAPRHILSAFARWLRLSLVALIGLSGCERESTPPPAPLVGQRGFTRELAQAVARIEAKEQRINETVWAKEMLADDCGRVFEAFWDALNAATNKLSVAASFAVPEVVLAQWTTPRSLPHGIQVWEPASPGRLLTPADWRTFVEAAAESGWQLVQTEFRHNQFETDDAGRPHRSRFGFSAHLVNTTASERAVLEGDLEVTWETTPDAHRPSVKRVDASPILLKTRRGEQPFELLMWERTLPARNACTIGPLMVYDLDGDGFSEILLVGENLVYRRMAGGSYEIRRLFKHPPAAVAAAVIADFDGNGAADLLCDTQAALVLMRGSPSGTFDVPGQTAWLAPKDVQYTMFLACGDIDGDADRDVFLGQYKLPYDGGQMPTPFYDANDGYPAYLLLNDGHGAFRDATEAAGLGKKRWRRSFSGSFADLDQDGHLDLVVVSDFAGLDVYRNDGKGLFEDVTRLWFPQPHGFGMAHMLADFNADSRLDLLMLGMPSPTADRLEHLGLWRSDHQEDRVMRREMTYGNRLFYAAPNGGFSPPSANAAIARSGWSWGGSAADFDNDGYPDVYIANGMESRESVRDYDREFWLHDIYVANSVEAPAPYAYLQGKVTRLRGRGESYGGFEKNRLYLNQRGDSFLEAGHLFGLALELDSRNVIADDLDADGRVDLLVTSFEAWPQAQQSLRVYRNRIDGGNWVGFRFREQGGGKSPIGSQVIIRHIGGGAVRQVVTGDSHRAQHAATVHFGLGSATRVASAEVRWSNGETVTMRDLPANRYYSVP
ncbi:MAG: CRTAC1 family protein [Verrucomicrobiia bacterium]